jgi:hypothetical protein
MGLFSRKRKGCTPLGFLETDAAASARSAEGFMDYLLPGQEPEARAFPMMRSIKIPWRRTPRSPIQGWSTSRLLMSSCHALTVRSRFAQVPEFAGSVASGWPHLRIRLAAD